MPTTVFPLMTIPRLPSLNRLRAFEAAARHGSFSQAAKELKVTQTAISHQVMALEGGLRLRLFTRSHTGVRLTEAGATLFKAVHEGFARISEAIEAVVPKANQNVLSVSLMPNFSERWAIFRLKDFRQRFPDHPFELHHSREPVEFDKDGIDIAVRWGPDARPGISSTPLLGLDFSPMCSPELLRGIDPDLIEPAQYANFGLLHT